MNKTLKDSSFVAASVWTIAISLLALSGLPACSDPDLATTDGGTTGACATTCAAGLKSVGPVWVPIFDQCLGDEIPVLGGGCRHVGPPKTCLKGWAKVKGGWCEPILPKTKCPAGTMEVIGKTTCQPVGPPTKCLTGWALVTGGWCEPILPKGKCPAGTMEVIGKATCQPMGDCGSGTWGKIKTTASTIFVNQSYSGSSPDGSQSKPYITIGAALKAAGAGVHIVVAAGTYTEDVVIDKKVTLEGRCAQKVTITGAGKYTVEVKSSASGSVIRGLKIAGASRGVLVDGAVVTMEIIDVRGCEDRGVQVQSSGALTLDDSIVAGNREVGVFIFGAKAILRRTVVRDTREHASYLDLGVGIMAQYQTGKVSDLTLLDCVIDGNRATGIALLSSKATVQRSILRDTLEQKSDNKLGMGLWVACAAGPTPGSELNLLDSIVTGNRTAGIDLYSSKATVERSVVRDTLEDASDNGSGLGIQASVQAGLSRGSELILRDSLLARNRYSGIGLYSSKATLQRSVVRDTEAQASDKKSGVGIVASILVGQSNGSEVTLRDSTVSGNRAGGIRLYSSKATLVDSVVRDTREQLSDGLWGTGIQASVASKQKQGSELTLSNSLVTSNRFIGIHLLSSKATLQRSVVRNTLERVSDKMAGKGIVASVEPGQSSGSVLTLRDCLVERNRTAGILLGSSKATVERSIVRDTHAQASDMQFGTGIQVTLQSGQSRQSELTLRDSMVASNRFIGIHLLSSKATLQRSVVRDTRERASDKESGIGISAVVGPGQKQGSALTLEDSLVVRNRSAGIQLLGSQAKVERSVVRDTREQASDDRSGIGVTASFYPAQSLDSTLTLRNSLVARNIATGLFLIGGKATVECTVIRDTRVQVADKGYGTGIWAVAYPGQSQGAELTLRNSLVAGNRSVGLALNKSKAAVRCSVVSDTGKDGFRGGGDGLQAAGKSSLEVWDTVVERNARAGLLFVNSGGTARRCLIRENVFAIDLEGDAKPTIGTDNTIVDNKENDVTSRNLKVAPPPKL